MPMSTPPGLSVLSRACEGCILLASCKAMTKSKKLTARHNVVLSQKAQKKRNTGKTTCVDSWSVPLLLPVPLVMTCDMRYSTDRYVLGYGVISICAAIFSGDDGPVDGVAASFLCVGLLDRKTSLASLKVEQASNWDHHESWTHMPAQFSWIEISGSNVTHHPSMAKALLRKSVCNVYNLQRLKGFAKCCQQVE